MVSPRRSPNRVLCVQWVRDTANLGNLKPVITANSRNIPFGPLSVFEKLNTTGGLVRI